MTNIVKQVVGIDVAAKELVVSLGRMSEAIVSEIYAYKTFSNKASGFKALQAWVKKHTCNEVMIRYVMEATGVYHEKLAYHLSDEGLEISVVLPTKVSSYLRSLDIKTVTDKTASQAICLFGLERTLTLWKKPNAIFKSLKQLTRERDQVVADRTMVKNQLHAEKAEAEPNERSAARMERHITFLNDLEKEIKRDIAETVKTDQELVKKIDTVATIPGVGKLTVVITLAETNGFDLIRSQSQLVSYSGLDIKEKQSGTSVKGKPRISKSGNRHLRKAMHMPALSAIQHDERFKSIFVRLVSKHGIKMKATVAVQRKLLQMIYTIWKTGKPYDKTYLQKANEITP